MNKDNSSESEVNSSECEGNHNRGVEVPQISLQERKTYICKYTGELSLVDRRDIALLITKLKIAARINFVTEGAKLNLDGLDESIINTLYVAVYYKMNKVAR